MLSLLHRVQERMGPGHERIGRKALRGWQFVLAEEPLLILVVHLLESLAFASEFERTIIVNVGSATGMFFRQFPEPGQGTIAELDHFSPSSRNPIHVLLAANAHNRRLVK